MDVSDKIITFENINELKAAILNDINSKDVNSQRYCVRFIMLNSFEVFRLLTYFLTNEMGVEIVNLEDKTLGIDKSLPIETLLDVVKGVDKSSIITPFSELVRFYPENLFNGFFNQVILTEDTKNKNKRIYIPIIGLQNRFNDFVKNFGRISESAPIWRFNEPQDDRVTVYVSKYKNFDIPKHLQICSLATMADWLKFWKRQAPQAKILCGAQPILAGWRNSRPDSIFTFHEVNNAYDFISEFLEINVPIEYNSDDDKFWEALLQNFGSNATNSFSFRKFVLDFFNRKNLEFKDILILWAERNTTPFGRWLLKHYVLTQEGFNQSPYLLLVLSEINEFINPESLFVNIAERILYAGTAAELEKYFAERKQLMQSEGTMFRALVPQERQDWLENRIKEYSQQEENLNTAKKLCTGTFKFERKLFLGWFVHRDAFTFSNVESLYPDLAGYLTSNSYNDIKSNVSWVSEYFRLYRSAKIKDEFTSELHTAIKEQNKDADSFFKWFYTFEESHELLTRFKNDETASPDKVYWIDGLGAEFLPYILYLIDKSNVGYETIHSEIARTTIPSNTSINSFDVDSLNNIKLSELDELAHSGHYKRLETMVAELEVVKKMIYRILDDNKIGNHTIAIVSDHGLSAMSRKVDSLKLKVKTKHEGRYVHLEDGENPHHDDLFIVEYNQRDNQRYMVALTHASLGTKPTHEVHGGATPEEVLVPFVLLTNNDLNKPVLYTVKPKDTRVPISSKTLQFTIMPEPKSAVLTFGNKDYPMTRKNSLWSAVVEDATEGKHTIIIKPFRGKFQSFEIEFYGMGFNSSFMDDDDF